MTGTYDRALNTIYWPTGNPGNDHNGDEREGDNLYSCSILALDAKTGKMKWYYQYTPHDVWDWDGQEPPVLVDAEWQGQQRKLLLNANRNGFFYVLDRTDGRLLLAKPFVKKLTWAREIGPDGRPVKNPNQEPTANGVKVCPSLIGAANWWSTAFIPATGLYYVHALESCSIYSKKAAEWQAGRGFSGGAVRNAPDEPPTRSLQAIDIRSGKVVWEIPEAGPGTGRGGILATASGLLFFCNDANEFMAADATNGKVLWSFSTNQFWRASPMTYEFDSKQHVAIASGPNIIAFSLAK